ncbi:hypothetical protein CEXT_459231 [Caerostris extrusa]|uniref:Uncharacterized protein n=1 Tax=Caerostris extrusa TaxID=172846 RepID=A0AAV4Q9D9_CAEEX|nr:hypothetical protein CEXT_459231 [Caerostris extrusa]
MWPNPVQQYPPTTIHFYNGIVYFSTYSEKDDPNLRRRREGSLEDMRAAQSTIRDSGGGSRGGRGQPQTSCQWQRPYRLSGGSQPVVRSRSLDADGFGCLVKFGLLTLPSPTVCIQRIPLERGITGRWEFSLLRR